MTIVSMNQVSQFKVWSISRVGYFGDIIKKGLRNYILVESSTPLISPYYSTTKFKKSGGSFDVKCSFKMVRVS